MVSGDSGQTADESKNGFVVVLHRMLKKVSKSSPELMGWSDCGTMFRFDPFSDAKAMKHAITPFFSHGNFSSMRRQLSAYKFVRKVQGKHQGYWYHPRFHVESSDKDFAMIQNERRRRKPELKSQKVDKSKPAHAPLVAPRITGPLANLDVNAANSHCEQLQGKNFPVMLHNMLTTLSSKVPHLMGWSKDGESFFINQDMFLEHSAAIKTFFPHGNFASIRRQLSAYGFRRLSSGHLKGYWYHPSFTSKRMYLSASDRCSKSVSNSTDSSVTSYEEQEDSMDSTCPTTAMKAAFTDVQVKSHVLATYYCNFCLYMEGKICCNNCPSSYHGQCKTSRCLRKIKHLSVAGSNNR